MSVRVDAVGNLRGLWPGRRGCAAVADRLASGYRAKCRSVRWSSRRGAGCRDGGGVAGKQLPFAIEVIGFSEEEGRAVSQAFSRQLRAGGQTRCELCLR